jgi:hypothetical protein
MMPIEDEHGTTKSSIKNVPCPFYNGVGTRKKIEKQIINEVKGGPSCLVVRTEEIICMECDGTGRIRDAC